MDRGEGLLGKNLRFMIAHMMENPAIMRNMPSHPRIGLRNSVRRARTESKILINIGVE